MEEKTPEFRPDDTDDSMVSSSPDSGLCDLDLKSGDTSPKRESLLDPHLYNRRLTLLKSLSQDSEYSLDTSLFDAEEFLQDMGFAGGRDPTIPDRFLPSLMQRLSRFPESDMESLHDRIIQSIGCFRRKEGKRRLFRNLSMGKDPWRKHFLGCPSNCHPLLRSNTDPSTFPYEETSSTASSSSLLQSGRLSSNDSRLHSLGSSKDDCEFPESPIAILVSAASVDQDHRADSEDLDETSPSDMATRRTDAASQADLDDDAEFLSTVEGIQKLTDEISVQEDDDVLQIDDNVFQLEDDVSLFVNDVSQFEDNVSQTEDDVRLFDNDVSQPDDNMSHLDDDVPLFDNNVSQPDDNVSQPDDDVRLFDDNVSLTDGKYNSNRLLVQKEEGTRSEDSNLREVKPVALPNNINSFADVTHNCNSLKFTNSTVSDKDFGSVTQMNGNVSESRESSGKTSNLKTPLRRTSNAHFYNPKNLRTFDNIQNQKNTELGDWTNAVTDTSGIWNESQYSMESEGSNSKLDELESALNRATIFNGIAMNSGTEPGCLQNESVTSSLSFQSMPHNNDNKFSEPKYSRADSLTNFLSSMLDTSDIAGARSLIPALNPFSDNKCNSDSEMPGSFASAPFISFGSSDVKSKSLSIEGPKKIPPIFAPVKSSKITESIGNAAPNRKRRALRRMSSSLQCCDDVNCGDSDGLKADSLGDDARTVKHFSESSSSPTIKHGNFKSVPSSHRAIHSCSSLPVINACRTCNARCENGDIDKNVIDCQAQIPANCCDCEAKRKDITYFKKCKRKRNLSCPAPEISLNHNTRFKPKTAQCDCMVNKHARRFTEHTSVILPCNFSQKEARPICGCFNGNSNYRLNLCCSASPSNIFLPPNVENCDTNIRCLGPPSPSLLQPSNDTFAFGPNIWNQNRHLCYSSPDLRQECCSIQSEHCSQRSFTNADECYFNSFDKHGPQPFQRDNHFTDDVFLKEPCRCCSYVHSPCFNPDQDPKKTRMSIRSPQRQNSISIADSDITTHNSTTDSNNFPVPLYSNKDDIVKEPLPPPTIPNVGIANGNVNDNSSTVNVPKASHLSEAPFNTLTLDNKPNLISKLKTEDTSQILHTKPPSSPTTKSEALLERKIRIFSKFLANLGNLSKSIPDTDVDNRHKRITRDQKPSDVYDKKTKSRANRVSCPAVQSVKHSGTQPELDKLLSLLKSMDLSNKNIDKVKVLNENSVVSEQCEENLQVNRSPVYENKVLLEAKDGIGRGRHRSYKPVLYSSSVSLYINAEDKMDTQINRNEKAATSPDGDRKEFEAPGKIENSHNRSSHQMSFRSVSKEIEDLQLSIQKAKETRMCASKELHLLQELLSVDVMGESATKEKKRVWTGVDLNRCEQEEVSRSTDAKPNQALADLREKSKKEVLEDTSFWQEEIQKVKEETKQAWQAKMDRMEARLLSQEEDLRRVQSDNEALHRMDSSPSCQHCRTTENNGRTDSAFEDDEEYLNHKAPSIPIQSTRQECDRLQQRLVEEEQRADQLNLMLNQKLIELNKIQITLSKQTKEMIELEKSYLQLQCRLRRGTSKPVVSRLCSRSSPFSPKNLCPKPSPPASPQPANGTT